MVALCSLEAGWAVGGELRHCAHWNPDGPWEGNCFISAGIRSEYLHQLGALDKALVAVKPILFDQ